MSVGAVLNLDKHMNIKSKSALNPKLKTIVLNPQAKNLQTNHKP